MNFLLGLQHTSIYVLIIIHSLPRSVLFKNSKTSSSLNFSHNVLYSVHVFEFNNSMFLRILLLAVLSSTSSFTSSIYFNKSSTTTISLPTSYVYNLFQPVRKLKFFFIFALISFGMNFTILYNSYFNTLICNSKDGIDKDMNKKIASN